MFGRYLATICMTAAFGLGGCTSHRVDTAPPEPRPLWQEIEAYRAPEEPDSQESMQEVIHETAGELQFKDALALSLLHNPRLADVAWSIRISEARALQAGLLPNPKLEMEIEEFGGEGPRKEFDGAESTVRLSQLIELGGKRGARREVSDIKTQLAYYDYETERLTVLTDATLSFIDVLTAQNQLVLAEDLLRLSKKTYESVTERVKAGKVSPLEETKASIELANQKIELVTAKSALKIARKHLAATWGSESARFIKAAGSLDDVADIPPLESLEMLIEKNPAIARWAGEMEYRLAELALERAQRVFDLTLSAGITRFDESDDYAFSLGMSLPIPIFDRNQGGVREASYRVAQGDQQKRAARVRISIALLEAYEALASARTEALALQKEVVPASARAYDAALNGYRQGKFGYLEVLDAQRTFAEANARLPDALTRYHRAVALVESLIGTRLSAVIEDESSQMEERQ